MNNQLISWAMFVVPWLSLFFMKKEDIKRYMPLALLSALTSVIIYEMGISYQWWIVTETSFPLRIQPFHLGLFPVLTMWIFKFTFRKFWLFMAVELVTNAAFDFGFLGWFLPARGILHFGTMTPLVAVCVTTVHGLILYGYQVWQDGILIHSNRDAKKIK